MILKYEIISSIPVFSILPPNNLNFLNNRQFNNFKNLPNYFKSKYKNEFYILSQKIYKND